MKLTVHAGHNPDGKVACGACGLIKESTEARNVTVQLMKLLKNAGHTVYNCTVNNGKSQNDVLKRIVDKCNAKVRDYDISIHFNSGADDEKGNGRTTGVEVFVYSETSKCKQMAEDVCKEVAKLGFKNRGVKVNKNLYVLHRTTKPAMLIECCFVDDKDDVALYNHKQMARAIYNGITKRADVLKHKVEDLPSLKKYDGNSIVDGLKKCGYKSNFAYRKDLWKRIGETSKYLGTASQNAKLLKILKTV